MIIGIDYSIKSPALTILNANNEIIFVTLARNSVIKKGIVTALEAADVKVVLINDEPAHPKKTVLEKRERSSLEDAIMQTAKISNLIKEYEEKDLTGLSEHELHIGIEGFSFGSTGNRLAQISGYQYMLRYMLYSKHDLNPTNFWVYAPMTIKAVAGKGNFKKEQMIEAFINCEDPRLRATGLWKAISENPAQFQTKRGLWEKPLDDIIDSFWVLITLESKTIKTI